MIILCDFDDTTATQNVGQLLLEHFQPEEGVSGVLHWRDVRQRFLNKEISLAEYQEITFRQMTVTRRDLVTYVSEKVKLRAGFSELAKYCREAAVELAVVSHGLDFYVQAALEKAGLDLPVYAVETGYEPDVSNFRYPFADEACNWWPGNCKCRILETLRSGEEPVVYAGDSASDACPALKADYVFARDWLKQFCHENDVPHAELTDFYALANYVKMQLGDRS